MDSLTTLASSLTKDIPRLIKVEVVKEPSIDTKANVSVISTLEPCWMDPIVDFLAKNHLSSEMKEFGCPRIVGYTRDLLVVLTCYASILEKLMNS